jgi:RHS repeat-associated protein
VAQLNSFDPFCKVNSSQNLNSFGGQSYGFTGLEHDESGLVYARNRYYSPALGRFISEDPIGFGGGSNFYAYCGNDPINFTDPLGLYSIGAFMEDARNFGNDLTAFGDLGAWGQLGNADWGDGMATGAHAAASAMSFGLYDGGSYRCKPGFNTSKVLGGIAREALMQAGGEAMARCGSQLFASAMARRPGMGAPGLAAAGKAMMAAEEGAEGAVSAAKAAEAADGLSLGKGGLSEVMAKEPFIPSQSYAYKEGVKNWVEKMSAPGFSWKGNEIVLDGAAIWDGHHRLIAARLLGIKPVFIQQVSPRMSTMSWGEIIVH